MIIYFENVNYNVHQNISLLLTNNDMGVLNKITVITKPLLRKNIEDAINSLINWEIINNINVNSLSILITDKVKENILNNIKNGNN